MLLFFERKMREFDLEEENVSLKMLAECFQCTWLAHIFNVCCNFLGLPCIPTAT